MNLPFTPAQFFEVFSRYNAAVWPMQLALNAAALACIALLFVRQKWAPRAISLTLSLLWTWVAAAYHFAFFADVNPAAWLFGILFLIGALLFAWLGVVRDRLRFHLSAGWRGISGWALTVFALAIYPAIGYVVGHRYPAAPTFGLPCPTTIFTVGMLLFAAPAAPRAVFVAPIVWAAIGSLAAFRLGVFEDLALLVAGVVGLISALEGKLRLPRSRGSP